MSQIPTTITAVTVYPDRARVTRSGDVSLAPGFHRLEITDLPIRLNPESVRASARGTAQARLLGVQVQHAFFSETPVESVRRLEEQIETLQDELRGQEGQLELVKQNRVNLNALAGQAKIFATALAAGETSVEKQLALYDGLRGRAETLDKELLGIAAAQRIAERKLTKFKNELDQQRAARPRERFAAAVEVEILTEGNLSVEISYVVAGAGWKPLYDLRLLEGEAAPVLAVNYLAQVTQQTGEAWEEVALTLSTARPALAGRVPELDPCYVQPLPPLQPVPVSPGRAVAAEERALPAMVTLAAPVAPITEAEVVVATVESVGASVAYRVPTKANIPSDGAPHKANIATYRMDPRLDYVTAPKLVEAAYRRSKAVNDSPYTLLPGPANLFAGDEFIGTTNLELIASRGEMELYLGVEDRVRVERELKRREVDKRLIGGKRLIYYGYTIELENLLETEAKITLHDQMPVPGHEDIKVRLESADPKPTEQTELNLLNWELLLASKEKRIVRFDFSVEHPQGMRVVGLP